MECCRLDGNSQILENNACLFTFIPCEHFHNQKEYRLKKCNSAITTCETVSQMKMKIKMIKIIKIIYLNNIFMYI